MWKARPDDKPIIEPTSPQPASPQPSPGAAASPASSTREIRSPEPPKKSDALRAEVAHIGKSVTIKGELSGSEDLYFDGEAEGGVDLREHSLTVGPNGRIRANIAAREIIVHGKIEGNLRASERIELKKSCVLTGDITTQRIVIEDGAFFKGAIDIQKDGHPELRKPAAAANAGIPALAAGGSPQVSFLEDK